VEEERPGHEESEQRDQLDEHGYGAELRGRQDEDRGGGERRSIGAIEEGEATEYQNKAQQVEPEWHHPEQRNGGDVHREVLGHAEQEARGEKRPQQPASAPLPGQSLGSLPPRSRITHLDICVALSSGGGRARGEHSRGGCEQRQHTESCRPPRRLYIDGEPALDQERVGK
jgi:hypothetical protein